MGCTSSTSAQKPRPSNSFCPIPDHYNSISEVQAAIRAAGLESSNLILAVDFTKSNTWTGRESFNNRCLHDVSGGRNPYQHVIEVLGSTLSEFDDDNLIPAYGFGDSSTGDRGCFPFNKDGSPCYGFEQVLERYSSIAREVRLAGPTCFAPVIRQAIQIVAEEQSYHILIIIADGQVTDSSVNGETARAIIEASGYPLSIITVGVGDGPWGTMNSYDDELPARNFDNFQFVEYNAMCSSHMLSPTSSGKLEARFALNALMEIPDQYKFIKSTGLLNANGSSRQWTSDSPCSFQTAPNSSYPPPPPPRYEVHAQTWAVAPALH